MTEISGAQNLQQRLARAQLELHRCKHSTAHGRELSLQTAQLHACSRGKVAGETHD